MVEIAAVDILSDGEFEFCLTDSGMTLIPFFKSLPYFLGTIEEFVGEKVIIC